MYSYYKCGSKFYCTKYKLCSWLINSLVSQNWKIIADRINLLKDDNTTLK